MEGIEKVMRAEDVLESLMNDGTMDAMRLKIIRELKGMEELKKTTIGMVEQSKVLNTPGAEKQTKRQLFDALRHELEAPALERASKLVWELILDNEGLGKEINQTVEKVFCRLSGREPPLLTLSIKEPRQDQLKEKESSGKEKEDEQIEEVEDTQRSSDPPYTPIDSVPDLANVSADCGKSFKAEPRRCGRTDGKNWRCSNNCVLDSKYCERHVLKSKKPKKPVETKNQGTSPHKLADGSPNIWGSTSSRFVPSKTNNNHWSSRSKRKGSPRRGYSPKAKKECHED